MSFLQLSNVLNREVGGNVREEAQWSDGIYMSEKCVPTRDKEVQMAENAEG